MHCLERSYRDGKWCEQDNLQTWERVVTPNEIAQVFEKFELAVVKFNSYFNEIMKPIPNVKLFKEYAKNYEEAVNICFLIHILVIYLKFLFYYLRDILIHKFFCSMNRRNSCTWWKKAYNSPIFTSGGLLRTELNILVLLCNI